jgi:putative oxidoreductase
VDTGLLVLRVLVGLYFAGHGAQKLFGWFGGAGLNGTPLPGRVHRLSSRTPVGRRVGSFGVRGGLLLVLGLLHPLGSVAIAASMVTAIVAIHWSKGPWNENGGFELPLVYIGALTADALVGPGRYSLDGVLGIAVPTWITSCALVAAVLGILLAFASRRLRPAEEPAATA